MLKKAKIAVVGSINMDLVVKTGRAPVPGETIRGEQFAMIPGGKGANQAVAAARLGADVVMIGCVGDDMFGGQMLAQLQRERIDTSFIRTLPQTSTGVAVIQVQRDGDNSIVIVPGANAGMTPEQVQAAKAAIRDADVMLVQLEIPLPAVESAVELAYRYGVRTILNPAPAMPLPDSLLRKISILTPNETEASMLTTGSAVFAGDIQKSIGRLKELVGTGDIIVTNGERGVFYDIGGTRGSHPAYKVNAVDTTAAGDCFNAGLAVRLGEGAAIEEAIGFACKAAAIAVTRFGAQTSLPTREEADRFA